MENYFRKYKERYRHKSVEDAIRATRNFAKGTVGASISGSIDPATLEKIEGKLDELRLKDP